MSASRSPSELELEPQQVGDLLAADPELQLVDVREPYEREAGYIEGSVHVALTELPTQVERFARERPLVFYCRVGARSEMAAQAFRAAGFEAYTMSGGLLRWDAEQRPLAPAGGVVAKH